MRVIPMMTLSLVAGLAWGAQTAAVSAITRNPADIATVTMTGDKALLTVSSPRGIGGATLDRKNTRWPALTLRLNLRGLESLKITAGRVVLSVAVSSSREGGQLLSLSTAGKSEEPLTRSSAYWTNVRVFDASGRATTGLPPAGGWFELDVPAALLEEGLQTLWVEWIDFYR